MPATLTITYKEPRAGLVVPGLYNHSVTMTRGECAGHYTLYRANWTIPGNESHSARLDVASGSGADVVVDDFYHAVKLPGACNEYHIPPPNKCAPVTVSMLPSPPPSSAVAPPLLPSTTMATLTTTPYVVAVHTSAVPAVSSTPVAATRPLSDGRPHDFEPGLLVAVKGFFGSLISEVASFFGYVSPHFDDLGPVVLTDFQVRSIPDGQQRTRPVIRAAALHGLVMFQHRDGVKARVRNGAGILTSIELGV